jgi:ABC-type phosphate/phosphonate transport system ATPase subunit
VPALLAIEGLAKVYRGGQRALDGVTFSVERPEVVAVIGSSGAGKSTLIRCINRLVEPTPATFVWATWTSSRRRARSCGRSGDASG